MFSLSGINDYTLWDIVFILGHWRLSTGVSEKKKKTLNLPYFPNFIMKSVLFGCRSYIFDFIWLFKNVCYRL
jgi:hypothetical protein